MRNGGGAIMAIGRAGGEQRVERAILDALDSPLLHGSDINRAKRILFNIYASDETPIRITEMQEIDEFFEQLDPDIDVIWGTSTDNSLGEDAKVIILATDMNHELSVERPVEEDDEEHYAQLINTLYQPLAKPKEEPVAEPVFEVEPAPVPEPAIEEERDDEEVHEEKDVKTPVVEPQPTTTLGKWKSWLNRKLGEMISEEDE